MMQSPSVTIRARPSISRSEKIQEEKKDRQETRKDVLGEQGLKNLDKILEEAKETNDVREIVFFNRYLI